MKTRSVMSHSYKIGLGRLKEPKETNRSSAADKFFATSISGPEARRTERQGDKLRDTAHQNLARFSC